MHTGFIHLKKEKIPISDTLFLVKVREMLPIRRDYDLPELQCHLCGLILDPIGGFLVVVSVTGTPGAAVRNKNPGKAHALLPSIDLPSSFAFFKLLLLCSPQYSLPLQMVSQQREPSPLIPSPGNSRSLCRELVQRWSGMFFNTWLDLSVDSCPDKCLIICYIFCRSGSEVSFLTLQQSLTGCTSMFKDVLILHERFCFTVLHR